MREASASLTVRHPPWGQTVTQPQLIRVMDEQHQLSKYQEHEIEALNKLVKEAKDNVDRFAKFDAGGIRGWEVASFKRSIGMNEGLCQALQLAALDEDGDGKLNETEVERYYVEGQKMVDTCLNTFLNQGVVSALMLSIVFPLAVEEHRLTIDWDGSYGDSTVVFALNLVAYVALMIIVATSLSVLYATSLMYSQLSFMMPNLRLKLWYLRQIRNQLTNIEVGKATSMYATAAYLLFSNLASATWMGFIALIPLFMVARVNTYLLGPVLRAADKELLHEAQQIIAKNHAVNAANNHAFMPESGQPISGTATAVSGAYSGAL